MRPDSRLWRLPASVRSLAPLTCRTYTTSTQHSTIDPLRILFCGSDDFSIASLRALAKAQRKIPNLIESLNVVHRPAKPTGRGLKTLRDVPIRQVATSELHLPTHIIDTFTGWTPPPSDLIVAVSFGLFVPPRILREARYGGINVHPSLLPDLRGPAPIEHAILRRRTHTGVSIQTLHPTHFDHGVVLAQTEKPGMPIPHNLSAKALGEIMAAKGACMLVDVLTSGRFVLPGEHAGWYTGAIEHAPKITKQDRCVDFSKKSIHDIRAMQNALGDLWCVLPNGNRVILHELYDTQTIDVSDHKPGIWNQKGCKSPLFRAACGTIGMVLESTYAGSKARCGNAKVLNLLPEEDRLFDKISEYPWSKGKV